MYFLTALEAGSLRLGCRQGQGLVTAHFTSASFSLWPRTVTVDKRAFRGLSYEGTNPTRGTDSLVERQATDGHQAL